MVEINNQRKAFSIAWHWSGGTDQRTSENQKSWLWRHCRRRAIYWLLRSPSQTCHAKPKTQINRRRTLPASFPDGGCLPANRQPESFSEKVGHARCSKLKAWPCYDWSLVHYRRAIWPLQQYRLTAGRWLWSVQALRWQPDCRFGGGTVRSWCMTNTAIISALVICIIVCLSWAVNHYHDNAIAYKAQRDKNAENWSWRTQQLQHADASAWCCCARCKIHEGVADAKAENDALRDDVAAGRRRLHIKAVCQSVREATTASGVDNAASPDWQAPLGSYFTLRRGWSLCKNNWKEPRSILMSSADRVAHIDGQLMQLLWAIHASSGV